jgi:hypothetical protein
VRAWPAPSSRPSAPRRPTAARRPARTSGGRDRRVAAEGQHHAGVDQVARAVRAVEAVREERPHRGGVEGQVDRLHRGDGAERGQARDVVGCRCCACSMRGRRPAPRQTGAVASSASITARLAASPIACTTGRSRPRRPARSARSARRDRRRRRRCRPWGRVEHPRGPAAEGAVREELGAADGEEVAPLPPANPMAAACSRSACGMRPIPAAGRCHRRHGSPCPRARASSSAARTPCGGRW